MTGEKLDLTPDHLQTFHHRCDFYRINNLTTHFFQSFHTATGWMSDTNAENISISSEWCQTKMLVDNSGKLFGGDYK